MTLMLSVSGCRGIVGQTLTPQVASRFAGAFASFLRSRAGGKPVTVVLGRDGRAGGNMLHHAAISGILGSGAHVVDIGIGMTPTVAVGTEAAVRQVESTLPSKFPSNPQQVLELRERGRGQK